MLFSFLRYEVSLVRSLQPLSRKGQSLIFDSRVKPPLRLSRIALYCCCEKEVVEPYTVPKKSDNSPPAVSKQLQIAPLAPTTNKLASLPKMRNIFSALSLFLLAALAAVPVAHAAVVFQIEYLRSSLQGGCGPILGNDVQDVLITVFVPLGNVQNLKCPRPLYAASMATAKCQIADGSTDSAYGIRTWCIEGLTMPMSSNGIYGCEFCFLLWF